MSLSVFLICLTVEEKKKPEDLPSDDDVLIVYELTPTPEQKALASKLQLPPTFFCYKNRPDYASEEEGDGEPPVALKRSAHGPRSEWGDELLSACFLEPTPAALQAGMEPQCMWEQSVDVTTERAAFIY